MASTVIQNAPKDLDMNTFRAISSHYGALMKGGRFVVRIVPVGRYVSTIVNRKTIVRDLSYLCEIGEMPGRSFMNVDLRYYGPNQKLPFQSVYDDITFTFICRSQSYEREFFDDWLQIINPTTHYDFTYRDDYRARIEIFQYADYSDDNDDPVPTYKLSLEDAFPLSITPQPLVWGDNQITKVLVTFTYTKYLRDDFKRPNMSVDWRTNTPGVGIEDPQF